MALVEENIKETLRTLLTFPSIDLSTILIAVLIKAAFLIGKIFVI